jgi:hypothetical protein
MATTTTGVGASIAARLERLATLEARELARLSRSPFCIYCDGDSVVMEGGSGGRRDLRAARRRLKRLRDGLARER